MQRKSTIISVDLKPNEDPKYLCCCGKCHVKTGTAIFVGIFIFLTILHMFAYLPYSLVIGLFLLIIIACTMAALQYESPQLLWPFFVASIVLLVGAIVAAIVLPIYVFEKPENYHSNFTLPEEIKADKRQKSILLEDLVLFSELTLVSVMIVAVWQMVIIWRCMRLFRDKAAMHPAMEMDSHADKKNGQNGKDAKKGNVHNIQVDCEQCDDAKY